MPDWESIKTEYITGSASLRELAETYDVSAKTLQNRGAREKWSEARKKYREKVGQNVQARAARVRARELEGILQHAEKIEAVLTLIEDKMASSRKTGAKDLYYSAMTLRQMLEIRRDLYGLPTQSEAEAQKTARKRIEIEERKAKTLETKSGKDGGDMQIIVEGLDLAEDQNEKTAEAPEAPEEGGTEAERNGGA